MPKIPVEGKRVTKEEKCEDKGHFIHREVHSYGTCWLWLIENVEEVIMEPGNEL